MSAATIAPCAPRSRRGLSILSVLVAVSAYGGAVGLVSGSLSLGDVERRLPFHSPVLGGIALAVLVGVPFTVLAAWAWRGDRRTNGACVFAAILLFGWLLVELAFIRTFSFFHPLYGAIAGGFLLAGRRHAPHPVHSAAAVRFLGHHRIALIGASADPKKFGNTVFRELRGHGHEVVPVNTSSGEVDGVPSVRSVAAITGEIGAAMVMVTGDAATAAVQECVDRGIHHIWLFQGAGPGAVSDSAITAATVPGVELVPGACPLMFLEPVASFHKVHLHARRMTGHVVQ